MIAELINKMKVRRASAANDAWAVYRATLRKSADGSKLSEKEVTAFEDAVAELKISPEDLEQDAGTMARHFLYAQRVASLADAEEERVKLEAIRAELNAAARRFDDEQSPKWAAFHSAREQNEQRLAELRGHTSNLKSTEESAPHLFPQQ